MRISRSYLGNNIRLFTGVTEAHAEALSTVEFVVDGTRIPDARYASRAAGGYIQGWKHIREACDLDLNDEVKFELLEGTPAVLRITKLPPGAEPTVTPRHVGKRRASGAEAGPSAPKSRSESKTEYHSVEGDSDSIDAATSEPSEPSEADEASVEEEELNYLSDGDPESEEVLPRSARRGGTAPRGRAKTQGPPEVRVGAALLLGPPNLHFGTITAVLPPAEGEEGPRVQATGTAANGHSFTVEMPFEEAQQRVEAAAPGRLIGATIKKFFEVDAEAEVPDDSELVEGGWLFRGFVQYVPEKDWYHVTYGDGDAEDLEAYELLPLISQRHPGWFFCPAGWTGPEDPKSDGAKRQRRRQRGRPPSGGSGGRPSGDADGGSGRKRRREVAMVVECEEVDEVEDAGPGMGGAQLKKKRQSGGRGAATGGGAVPMEDDAPGPSEPAVPAEDAKIEQAAKNPKKKAKKSGTTPKERPAAPAAAAAADGDAPDDPSIWITCGAGHARGVQAYYRPDQRFRDIGLWIVDKKRHTLPGRFLVDYRHLDLDSPPARGNDNTAGVPGWIGVKGMRPEGAPVDSQPIAPFTVAFYDTAGARQRRMLFPEFETAAEAAATYDRVALAYYGGAVADLNFPVEQSVRDEAEAAAKAAKPTGKGLLIAAVSLINLERLVPDEAVDPGVGQEAWKAWESAVLDGFIYQRREASKENVAELGGGLAWLLQQIYPEALLPQWREPEALEKFLDRCRRCKEVGARVPGGPPPNSLSALIVAAKEDVMSQDALEVLGDGGTREAAAAAADAEAEATKEERERKKKKKGDDEENQVARRRGRKPKVAAVDPDNPRPSLAAYGFKDRLPAGLRVVVIGGGVAGLKAAADLQRAGAAAVTVLEARHRLGGRIYSHTLAAPTATANATVDLGASFIRGTSRQTPMNPLVPFMKDFLKIKTVAKYPEGPEGVAFYSADGTPVQMVEQLVGEERYTQYLTMMMERGGDLEYDQKFAAAVGSIVPGDESTGAASEAVLEEMDPPLEDFERFIVENLASDMYPAPLDALSLPGSIASGFEGPHEAVPGGLGQLTASIAAGKDNKAPEEKDGGPGGKHALKDVRLGRVVREVALGADGRGVRVTAAVVSQDSAAAGLNGPQTQEPVSQDDIEVIEADAVVVTLPLGVLKAGAVAFSPPLPLHKSAALDGLAVAPSTRVGLLFPTPWWATRTLAHVIRPLAGDYNFVNAHALGTPNALVTWVRPKAMARIERLTDAEVLEDVLRVLRGLFPGADVPAPLDSVVMRWGADPYAQGAYCCVPVGGSKGAFDALAVPVSGDEGADDAAAAAVAAGAPVGKVPLRVETRLFFAGEATHRPDPYSVHGAMESGRREARRVAEWWRQHAEAVRTQGPAAAEAEGAAAMAVDKAVEKGEEEELEATELID